MKTISVLLVLVAVASASPVNGRPKVARNYIPEEEDPHRFKYIYFEDEQGVLHVEDLTIVPETRATEDDVTLYLYTQDNPADGVPIPVNTLTDLAETTVYDSTKDNYFIIHGWNNDYSSNMGTLMRNSILQKSDSNVFVVDWGTIAYKLYPVARLAVPDVGEFVGEFINDLMDRYDLSPKKFKLIGHSLGAHVAGCAGAKVNGLVDYISGLDPASPLFSIGNTGDRLDETDAEFVQVIHTSSAMLAFKSSIGHADYFPNGGESQPGCGLDLAGTCAHSRAYEYYYESILSGGFNGPECDSYTSYETGMCKTNPLSYIGSLDIDKSASGDYYFDTNRKSPFSKN